MLSIPTENNVLYKRQEREIGKAVEKVARGSCLKNLNLARKIAQANSKAQNNDDFPGIAVSYDMGWQKRGKGHNSLIAQGAGMGVVKGKYCPIPLDAKPAGSAMLVKRQVKL